MPSDPPLKAHASHNMEQHGLRAFSSSSVELLASSSSTVGFPAVYTLLLLLPPTVQDGIALFTVLISSDRAQRGKTQLSSPQRACTHTGTALEQQQQTVWKTGTDATGLNTGGRHFIVKL